MHPNLKFTIEYEQAGRLPFLDMCIIHTENRLRSTWYTKPTDTGLFMNFHALAPRKYKRSVVQGLVHRIFRACSDWELFDESLCRAKQILERNQFPPEFYEPILADTINNLISPPRLPQQQTPSPFAPVEQPSLQLRLQYRGRETDNIVRKLNNYNVPVKTVITLRKLKTVLPSLKPSVPKFLRSNVVYQIRCPGCDASYVGQTVRHVKSRIAEHRNIKQPVGAHFQACIATPPSLDDVEIVSTTTRGVNHLMTLEALVINERNPELNTKDEYRSLTLKF